MDELFWKLRIHSYRFRDEGDDKSMEVGWKQMLAEEKRSARLGEILFSL